MRGRTATDCGAAWSAHLAGAKGSPVQGRRRLKTDRLFSGLMVEMLQTCRRPSNARPVAPRRSWSVFDRRRRWRPVAPSRTTSVSATPLTTPRDTALTCHQVGESEREVRLPASAALHTEWSSCRPTSKAGGDRRAVATWPRSMSSAWTRRIQSPCSPAESWLSSTWFIHHLTQTSRLSTQPSAPPWAHPTPRSWSSRARRPTRNDR